jgi:ribosomal-protein-alanine N-acetyltransferase
MSELETPRLWLRRFTMDDLDAYHERIYDDADVMRYLPPGTVRPREDAERVLQFFIEYWNDHPFGVWAVVEKASGAMIGQAGLLHFREYPDEVEVLYALGKAWWGKGYATEAGRASVRYGFEVAGLELIYAVAYPENRASQRVMEKIGMASQGLTSRYFGIEMACYVIGREDYDAQHHQQTIH